jgi:outer membrane receptor for ferrienterochelin and colicin
MNFLTTLTMRILLSTICVCLFTQLNAQILRGVIKTEKGEKVWGAIVQWNNKASAVLTDSSGHFQINRKANDTELTVSYVGLTTLKRVVQPSENNITLVLKDQKELKAVEIKAQKADNTIATLNPYLVESISSNELKKAPCCNLSESFETNGSVDVVYSDGLTGAKEIQMLGLRGIYTQLMVENRPDYYGLAAPYALEYIPGTWIEGIDINKGMGSVKNGFAAITGQINTELEKPGKGKRLFINLFGESTNRLEANIQTNHRIGEHLYTGLLVHADWMNRFIDDNNDGFRDMPLKKQGNALYRLFYNTDKIHAQINIQGIKEERESGLLSETNPFLIKVNTERFSVFGKLGYTGFAKPYNAFGSQWSATYHDMSSIYGKNNYYGTQRSFYTNLIYSTIAFTTDHKINVGSSFQYDDYKEFLNDKNLSRTEGVVGAFGEYTYSHLKKGDAFNDWTVITGLRTDFHNLYGVLFTPKLNVKYNFSEKQALRFSAGRGIRVANPISENISSLATNRAIIIDHNLKPEDAINAGLSYVMPVRINDYDGRLSIDVYRTQFLNQIVADLVSDYKSVEFYNLNGKSFSNSLLVMLTSEIIDGLDFKVAYKLNDVKTAYKNGLEQMPLVAKHRGLMSFDYHSENRKWMVNLTTQIIGKQRLINHDYLPPQYRQGLTTESPAYILVNLSVNKKFKNTELYGGIENLTNYTQSKPIIAYDNPQSVYFDATQIYAPLMGRRFYVGVRFAIP